MVTDDTAAPTQEVSQTLPRKKVVQTMFTQPEYDRLKDYCYRNRWSMSEYVRMSVIGTLDNTVEEEPTKS